MKKAIITNPAIMEVNRVDDNRRLLYLGMQKEFGFDILTMDNLDLKVIGKYDLVFVHHKKYFKDFAIKNTKKLLGLPIKIIGYAADMEIPTIEKEYTIAKYRELLSRWFLRCDKILCDVFDYCKVVCGDIYETIFPKMVWWPKAVVAYDRYFGMPFNEKPELKCVVAGKLDDRFPLRQHLLDSGGNAIAYYSHPGYGLVDPKKYPIGDDFARELNRYVCGACPAKATGHVLEKHVIIPASGSLLLAERSVDFDRLGMEEGVHYISITKDNAIEVVMDVIRNPKKYTDIRMAGREFVRQNHTIKNRLATLRDVLKEMGDA